MVYLGFHFRGGGGFKIFWEKLWYAARGKATCLLGGFWACSTENFLKSGAICCVLGNILLKFCKTKNCKNIHFYIKIIYNVLLRTLYLGVLEHTYSPDFLPIVQLGVLEHIFCELSLKKIYINLNNIDVLLLRTSYRYGVFLG